MPDPQRKVPLKVKLKAVVITLIVIAFIAFAIANARTIEINFLFARVTMPRFLMLLAIFGLGLLTGWLIKPRRRQSRA